MGDKMIIREKYLSKIRQFYEQDLIKVITGIRRCGKSVILKDVLLNLQKRNDCKVLAFKSDIFYDGKDSQDINLKAN